MFDDIICMNRYGETVRSLAQWDLGQTLYIYDTNYPVAPMFQYSNQNTPEALTVQSSYVEGVLQCVVPNQLMIDPYPITCYIYIPEGEKNGTVVGMFKIPVRPRPKPSEFQYEDNVEIINIEILRDIVLAAVDDAEAYKDAASASATASAASATASATSATSASRSAAIATAGATLASESVADAAEQVDLATTQAEASAAKALVSEGFANGTQNNVPVGSSSPYYHNNSKYWSEQAAAIASQTLGGLTDVALENVSNGQVLTYDSAHNEWTNEDPVLPPSSLADLTDVDSSLQPSEGNVLKYDGEEWTALNFFIGDLYDVQISSPTDGATLVYNAQQGKWIPGNVQSDPYHKGTTAPANTNIFWVDTGNGGILKYHNGTTWVPVGSAWT